MAKLMDTLRPLAERRWQELQEELRALRAAFPGLGGVTERTAAPNPKRPRMSAKQRKQVSERMKAYWAARKKR